MPEGRVGPPGGLGGLDASGVRRTVSVGRIGLQLLLDLSPARGATMRKPTRARTFQKPEQRHDPTHHHARAIEALAA